jgi:hypothetical protein
VEDRRRAFAAALSADTEDLEQNYELPPFSLKNYELLLCVPAFAFRGRYCQRLIGKEVAGPRRTSGFSPALDARRTTLHGSRRQPHEAEQAKVFVARVMEPLSMAELAMSLVDASQ